MCYTIDMRMFIIVFGLLWFLAAPETYRPVRPPPRVEFAQWYWCFQRTVPNRGRVQLCARDRITCEQVLLMTRAEDPACNPTNCRYILI